MQNKIIFVVEVVLHNKFTSECKYVSTSTMAVSFKQAINNIRYRYNGCTPTDVEVVYIQPIVETYMTIGEKRVNESTGEVEILTDGGFWEPILD